MSGLPSRRCATAHASGVALDERADVVPEAAVPLDPAIARERPDLVQAGRVPRLGDELRAGEDRVGLDVPDDRRPRDRRAVLVARQDRRQVEPEAVDVHLGDPVAEAVEDHPAHDRLVRVERVAGAREVGVARAVVAVEEVVLLVGEAAVAERRPAVAALGRVVVDDVEDDLEPGPVERLHEVAELVDGALRAGAAA